MQNTHTPGSWNVLTRPDGTLWIQGLPDDNGWREICSLPVFPSRNHKRCEANARLIAHCPEMLAELQDCIRGLEVARKALAVAESCMGAHEMQDSKWDNARAAIYTAKVACHSTIQRAEPIVAKATSA